MSTLDDVLKAIGIGAIGVLGIGIVLFILTVMCALVAVFAYQAMPGDPPAVTISPIDVPVTQATIAPVSNLLFDENKTVPKGYYQFFSLIMKPGMAINVSIDTNGSPVDVMVMDSANYGKYVTAVNSIRGGQWQDFASENSVVKKSFEFIAASTDRYYIVVDNTKAPENGADAGKDVSVHATILTE